MAKTSSVEKNNRRRKMAKQYAGKRARLKAIAQNKSATMEERFEASSSWPSCRAIRRPRAFATAAR